MPIDWFLILSKMPHKRNRQFGAVPRYVRRISSRAPLVHVILIHILNKTAATVWGHSGDESAGHHNCDIHYAMKETLSSYHTQCLRAKLTHMYFTKTGKDFRISESIDQVRSERRCSSIPKGSRALITPGVYSRASATSWVGETIP